MYAGVVDITPLYDCDLFGYAKRPSIDFNLSERIEAHWLHFREKKKSIIFISIDSLFSSDDFENRLSKALKERGVNINELFVVSTHTHYAPALDPSKPKLGNVDKDYVKTTVNKIAEDICLGQNNNKKANPIEWHFASHKVDASVFRRKKNLVLSLKKWPFVSFRTGMTPNPSQVIDQELKLWVAKNVNSKVEFCLVSWPCHATSRKSETFISPDYIGTIRKTLHQCINNSCPVIFMPGLSGDVRPNYSGFDSIKRFIYPYPFQKTFRSPTKIEVTEFDAIIEQGVRNCFKQLNFLKPFTKTFFEKNKYNLKPVVASAKDYFLTVFFLNIGGVQITGFNAEMSSLWSEAFLNQKKLHPSDKDKIFTGYFGHCFGYLPVESQLKEGGYEVDGFRSGFGFQGEYKNDAKLENFILSKIKN